MTRVPGFRSRMVAAPSSDPVLRARESASLIGHPDQRWSIVLHARLAAPLEPEVVNARIAAELDHRVELGPSPTAATVASSDLDRTLVALAEEPYVAGESVLRAALVPAPDPGVILAAHHGALDGLGLIALLAVVLGEPVLTSARGVSPDSRGGGRFATLVARRTAEALFHPPTRIAGQPPAGRRAGECLAERSVPVFAGGTAGLTAAAVRTVMSWNREHGADAQRVAITIGASHRPGSEPTLDNRAAWLRIHVRCGDEEHVASTLRAAPSLPVGPSRHRLEGAGRLATRLLSRRLGSTLMVSNLGTITGPSALQSVSFYPVTHGKRAVALGATTVGNRSTLTLRAEAQDFDAISLERLLRSVSEELRSAS